MSEQFYPSLFETTPAEDAVIRLTQLVSGAITILDPFPVQLDDGSWRRTVPTDETAPVTISEILNPDGSMSYSYRSTYQRAGDSGVVTRDWVEGDSRVYSAQNSARDGLFAWVVDDAQWISSLTSDIRASIFTMPLPSPEANVSEPIQS